MNVSRLAFKWYNCHCILIERKLIVDFEVNRKPGQITFHCKKDILNPNINPNIYVVLRKTAFSKKDEFMMRYSHEPRVRFFKISVYGKKRRTSDSDSSSSDIISYAADMASNSRPRSAMSEKYNFYGLIDCSAPKSLSIMIYMNSGEAEEHGEEIDTGIKVMMKYIKKNASPFEEIPSLDLGKHDDKKIQKHYYMQTPAYYADLARHAINRKQPRTGILNAKRITKSTSLRADNSEILFDEPRPKNERATAIYLAGCCFYLMKNSNAAAVRFLSADRTAADKWIKIKSLCFLGVEEHSMGMQEKCIQRFKSASKLTADSTTSATIYRLLGSILSGDEAERCYEKAIALNSKPSDYYRLAIVYRNENNLSEAIKYANHAVSLHSSPGKYYMLLADLYKDNHDSKSALSYYQQALLKLKDELTNHSDDALKNMQLSKCCSELGIEFKARDCMHNAIHLAPNNSKYRYEDSVRLAKTNNAAGAKQEAEKAIVLSPSNAKYYDQLGCVNNDAFNAKEAVKNFKCAVQLDEKESVYHRDLGAAEIKLGRYEAAANQLKTAKRLAGTKKKEKCCIKLLGKIRYHHTYYDKKVDYVEELNKMVGLKNVKSTLRTLNNQAELSKIRSGRPGHGEIHLMFIGNPGTGKTTVAKLLCYALYQEHVTTNKNCVCVNATQLVTKHYGTSAKLVRKLIHRAMGGVLFIDEAYAIAYRKDGNNAAQTEIQNELVPDLEKYRNQIVVILAGYPRHMKYLLNHSNPGLRSRFPLRSRVRFLDYSNSECYEILLTFLKKNHFTVADSRTKDTLRKYTYAYLTAQRSDSRRIFSNARLVRDVYYKLDEALSNRLLAEYTLKQLKQLKRDNSPVLNAFTLKDVDNAFKRFTMSKQENALDKLEHLVGLKQVKSLISSCIRQMKVTKVEYGECDHDEMHLVFEGNPGTGKTTVAKLFCNILYQEGIVKSRNYVSISAPSLISKWAGQSAKNLRDAFRKAENGVLFIDEAYALAGRDNENASTVAELVDDVSEYSNKVVVILAGYPKRMEDFLRTSNAGLSSRFPDRIKFPDYDAEECREILLYDINKYHMHINNEITKQKMMDLFNGFIKRMRSNRKYAFANARTVYTFFKQVRRSVNDRLGKLLISSLKQIKASEGYRMNEIILADVQTAAERCRKLYKHYSDGTIGFGR